MIRYLLIELTRTHNPYFNNKTINIMKSSHKSKLTFLEKAHNSSKERVCSVVPKNTSI